MDNNVNQTPQTAATEAGRWVPVDRNSLGFDVPPIPNGQPVQGPDGALYCVGNSQSQLQSIPSNSMNAVPTPSSIIQMPPIVQPIALVPYTSQNQPLLQYDPYSRPVDPPPQSNAPVYIRKPYRGLSVALIIVAILAAVLMIVLSVFSGKVNGVRTAEHQYPGYEFLNGAIDIIKFDILDKVLKKPGTPGEYYTGVIGNVNGDILATIFAYALPFLAWIMIIGFVCLAIKYLVCLLRKRSPRCVSVAAIIEFLLFIVFAAGALLISRGENGGVLNAEGFFYVDTKNPASMMLNLGWLLPWILSFVLIILPLFAKKNAYMVDKSKAEDVHIIES